MKWIPNSLQRDILRRHAGPLVFCFGIIMFLLLMQFLIQFLDQLVGQGIPFLVILELIATNLAYMLVLAIPMTILAASLIAFGKFSENNEFTAVKAAGVHPWHLISPVLFCSVIIAIGLALFSNYTLPEANYQARALFMDIRMNEPAFELEENVFYDGIDGYIFMAERIPAESDSLFNITLFQKAEGNRERAVIKADRGVLQSDEELFTLTLYLEDGSIQRYPRGVGRSASIIEEQDFGQYRISFDISEFVFTRTDPEERSRDGRTMRAEAMLAVTDSLQHQIEQEYHRFNQSTRALEYMHTDVMVAGTASDLIPDLQYTDSDDTGNDTGATPGDREERRQQARNHAQEQNRAQEEVRTQAQDRERPAETTGEQQDQADQPMQTRFQALSVLDSIDRQQEIAQRSTIRFRSTFNSFENLQNNIRWRSERIAEYMVEVHKKLSIPMASIIFVLIGAPLGLLTRKGNIGINALISTLLFTYYWVCIIQGEKLADRLIISPFIGMWFANITLLIAGIILWLRVVREHNLFRLKS